MLDPGRSILDDELILEASIQRPVSDLIDQRRLLGRE
jgi:hypothetical protein